VFGLKPGNFIQAEKCLEELSLLKDAQYFWIKGGRGMWNWPKASYSLLQVRNEYVK